LLSRDVVRLRARQGNIVLAGDEGTQAKRAARQQEVDKVIADADSGMRRVDSEVDSAAIVAAWAEVKNRWAPLAGKVARRSISGKGSFAEHTALVGQLIDINESLLDLYALSLDPEMDTYYLIDMALIQSPALMESLGRLRAKGAGLLTAKEATADDRIAIAGLVDRAGERDAAMKRAVEKSGAANPALKAELGTPLADGLAAGSGVLQLAQDNILKADQLSFAAPEFFAEVTKAIEMQVKLYDVAVAQADRLLHARESALSGARRALVAAIVVLPALVILFGYLITQSGRGRIGCRGPRRRHGVGRGQDHGRDQRFFAQDRRHHRCHRRHCVPDQHSCVECGGRSRQGGRTRQRLCRGRRRSPDAGATLRRGRLGDQAPDQRLGGEGGCRHPAGRPDRCHYG
jgi:hypothetical protein